LPSASGGSASIHDIFIRSGLAVTRRAPLGTDANLCESARHLGRSRSAATDGPGEFQSRRRRVSELDALMSARKIWRTTRSATQRGSSKSNAQTLPSRDRSPRRRCTPSTPSWATAWKAAVLLGLLKGKA